MQYMCHREFPMSYSCTVAIVPHRGRHGVRGDVYRA